MASFFNYFNPLIGGDRVDSDVDFSSFVNFSV